MTIAWTDPIELSPAENAQDSAQHWLFVPPRSDVRNEGYKDLIVAYTFLFNSEAVYKEFKNDFLSSDDRAEFDGKTKVLFPEGLTPLNIAEGERLLMVGFAKLGSLSAIYTELIRREAGELFLTGLPVDNVDFLDSRQKLSGIAADDNIVAIIDTDIAFANARFRKSIAQTRIGAYWDQDASSGVASPLFLGRAIKASDIDTLLATFNQDGNVDEHALYAQYFSENYSPKSYHRLPTRLGHGTHVLDVMAGGDVSDSTIIAVDLRSEAVDATQGNFIFPWVAMALLWIAGLTSSGKVPHINYSFGGLAGRHDGKGPLEILLDFYLQSSRASAITIPAGNFFDTETHASFHGSDLQSGKTLGWRVQPDDGTSNALEVWLPECDKDDPQISLTLKTPGGGFSLTVTDADLGTYRELRDRDIVLARVYIQCVSILGILDRRARIAIYTRHTAIDRDYYDMHGGRPDLAGLWEISLTALSLEDDEKVEIWIERDDALGLAKSGARQSYFDAPRPVWPEVAPEPHFVRNAGTTSDLATGAKTLVAAGSIRKSRQPALYSSEGFDCPVRFPPTAAAICDDSRVHKGVLASGFFSGSTMAMNGTSVSSAVVAHIVGERIAAGEPVTRASIMALAAADDGRNIPPSAPINPLFETYDPTPPETRIGSGCLASGWTRLPRIDL